MKIPIFKEKLTTRYHTTLRSSS